MAVVEPSFSPPRDLKENLVQAVKGLQILPDVAIQAIAIADDPDALIQDLVDVIAQDVKLTSDILALSNCSLFGSSTPAVSLQKAIMRLGFRQTKSLILASSITSMMRNMPWREVRVRDLLCEHGMLTANLCTMLNGLFRLEMQGEEFTAGLVHDLGRTLLAVTIPNDFQSFDPLDFDEPRSILDREQDQIGTTHAEVGAWFVQRSGLPEELMVVARHHHSPQHAGEFELLTTLTALADEMANFCQRTRGQGEFDFSASPYLSRMEEMGVDSASQKLEESFAHIIQSAKESVAQMLRFT